MFKIKRRKPKQVASDIQFPMESEQMDDEQLSQNESEKSCISEAENIGITKQDEAPPVQPTKPQVIKEKPITAPEPPYAQEIESLRNQLQLMQEVIFKNHGAGILQELETDINRKKLLAKDLDNQILEKQGIISKLEQLHDEIIEGILTKTQKKLKAASQQIIFEITNSQNSI